MAGIACLGCVLVWASPLWADPLAERVPGDVLLYVGWAGTEAVEARYEGTHLQAVLDQTQVGTLFRDVLPQLVVEHEQVRALAGELWPVLSVMGARPWALYVRGEMVDDVSPIGEAVLLIDAGDEAARVAQAAERWRAMFEQHAGMGAPPTAVETDAGLVTIRLGVEPSEWEAAESLAANERFLQARAYGRAEAVSVLYADLARVIELIASVPDAGLDRAMVAALGLDGLEQLVATGGFVDQRWQSDVFLSMPADRRSGLLTLLDPEPMDESVLDRVPFNAIWASASQFDLSALLDEVRRALHSADPQAGEQLEGVLMQVSMMLGVDLEAELIDALGPTWVMHHDPRVVGFGGMGGVLRNRLRDPEAFDATLGHLERSLNHLLEQQQAGAPLNWRLVRTEHEGVTIRSAVLPLISPSWAVHDGYLHVALLPQAVMQAVEAPGRSIRQKPGYRAFREELGVDAELGGMSYVELQFTAQTTYQGYVALSQALPAVAVALGADEPAWLLPPLGAIMDHLGPAGGVSWTDDAGWHSRQSSPFPGSTLLGRTALPGLFGDSALIQANAMMVGTMLPALGAARRTARSMQSNTHARGIHQAMIIAAQADQPPAGEDRRLPDDIAALYQQQMFTLDYVFSPFTNIALPGEAQFNEWPEAQQNQWIRQHSSYILVPDLRDDLDSRTIAVFLRPDHSDGSGISVAYNDNRVVWEADIDAIDRTLQQQTGMTMQELIERQWHNVPAEE